MLHILDIPIPKDLDGNVIKDIFWPNSELFNKEIEYRDTKKTIEEKEKIKAILGNLRI